MWLAGIFSLVVSFRCCGLPFKVFNICSTAFIIYCSVHHCSLFISCVSLFLHVRYGSLKCLLVCCLLDKSLAADSMALQLSLQKNVFSYVCSCIVCCDLYTPQTRTCPVKPYFLQSFALFGFFFMSLLTGNEEYDEDFSGLR